MLRTLALGLGLGLALADQSTDRSAVLAPCDVTDPAQQWVLRDAWGAANTLLNTKVQDPESSAGLCLDIADRSTHDGAEVRGWQCCCAGSPFCGGCGDTKDNYNQNYVADSTTTPPNQIKTSKQMGGKCLVTGKAAAGEYVRTDECPSIDSEPNWVFYSKTAPHLRLAANTSLCLATPKGSAPPPPPPPGPGKAVPQACTTSNTSSLPFCNPSLPVAERVADLLKRITLDEKLGQFVSGIGGGITPGIPSVGVPEYQYHSEGLHGVRDTKMVGPSTLFPQVTAMAATGNISLVWAMADQMGDEARAANNAMRGQCASKGYGLNYWGPTMNVARDPRWGRIQESVSEDPWLNGAYSSAFVKGFQGAGDGVKYTKIAACCKHFYAYSLEGADGFTRHNFNAKISMRDLAETYGPPFEACVAAKPEQVMCSYNEVNGVPTCLDGKAQNGWLRGKLGFEGLIVSDCDAIGDACGPHNYSKDCVHAAASGIINGCDQDCGKTYKRANLQAALSQGLLNTSTLDVALARAFAMRFNLGMFDRAETVKYTAIGVGTLNNARGQALALEAARESVVLLQNRARLLPLDAKALAGKSVAMIGPTGDDAQVLMGGKSDYDPAHIVSLFEGLQLRANNSGFRAVSDDGSDVSKALSLARTADVVLLTVGGVLGSEGRDRVNITLPSEQQALVRAFMAAKLPKLVLVLVNGEPVAIDEAKVGVDTIVEALEGGQAGGTALAEVLFGDISPSGVLPFTMYRADYVNEVMMSDMTMRPDNSTGSKGKTYRFYTGDVLWPFGHGLSYTTWNLSWAPSPAIPSHVPVSTLRAGLTLSALVRNTGAVGAKKVVQLYVVILDDAMAPLRTLVAMEKVFVPAKASVTVRLNTGIVDGTCAFCVVDDAGGKTIKAGTRYSLVLGDGATNAVDPVIVVAA